MCIIFIGSEFIDPQTFPWVCYKNISGMYPNCTYGFSSPTGLWKVVARVPVFAVPPVLIDKFVGFNSVTQVHCDWLQVNTFKVFLFSFVKYIFRSGRGIDL